MKPKHLVGEPPSISNHIYKPDIQVGQGKPQIPSYGFVILAREGNRKVHVWIGKVSKLNKVP